VTRLRWGELSETGQVRSINQDSAYAQEPLFAVADGMGGHRGGEVASAVALETLTGTLAETTTDALVRSVQQANAAVFARAQDDPDLRGMGTTLCAIAVVVDAAGERIGIVNVGDSRIYLLRAGRLEQLTEDHSLVESLVRQGRITEDEAAVHPQRNILTRALGISPAVDVDAWEGPAVTGDRYLLCSDGLFNEVQEPVIEATLRKLADPTEAANELVRLANEGGGRDNITAVVVDVEDGPGPAGPLVRLTEPAEPDLGTLGAPPETRPQPAVQLPPTPGAVAAAEAPTAPAPPPPPPPVEPAPPAAASSGEVPAVTVGPKRRRFTWRVLVFVVALLALLGAVGFFLYSYGNNSWYVTFDEDDQVVIEQGRPGGFLIWDPEVVEETGVERDELRPVAVERVEAESDLGSLEEAQDLVENLERTTDGDSSDEDGGGDGSVGNATTTTEKPDRTTTTQRAPVDGAPN
jgi:protein phosphatase